MKTVVRALAKEHGFGGRSSGVAEVRSYRILQPLNSFPNSRQSAPPSAHSATPELLHSCILPLAFQGKELTGFLLTKADVAELADALDSKSSSRK
jgi:hypothetical protein